MIAVAGTAGALLVDLLIVRPMVSNSLTMFGFAGLCLYAILVLVISTAVPPPSA